MEEIEIMGRPLAEIRRIIAWYESLGSPSLFETDQQCELRHKQYEEAKKAYEAIPPNINANPLPTRSGETRQMYTPEPSMGDRMRANLKETLDTYCPYLPITEDAVAPVIKRAKAIMSRWDTCEHEWVESARWSDDDYPNVLVCTKCDCPGERQTDGSVYWPTT